MPITHINITVIAKVLMSIDLLMNGESYFTPMYLAVLKEMRLM